MKFETQTGSLYEVDFDKKMIRRLAGLFPAQPRQGEDGVWKAYLDIEGPIVGQGCLIMWPLTERSDPWSQPATFTSDVTRIHE